MQALDRSRCRGKGLGSSSRREKQEVGRSPWKELDSGMGGKDSLRIKSGKKKSGGALDLGTRFGERRVGNRRRGEIFGRRIEALVPFVRIPMDLTLLGSART